MFLSFSLHSSSTPRVQGRDAKLRSRFVHAVAAIAGVYPAVLTRQLLLTCLGAMQFAEPACRGRFLATLADKLPK